MLLHISALAIFCVLVMLMFHYRSQIILHVPERVKSFFPRLGHYTPLSSFADQAHAGMSSNAFDIEANIRDGDPRAGLDERGTQEVMEIMRRERVNFDQARLMRHNQILARNGIDSTGIPLDSKAVTRL
ncbi:hypothetical protein PILCRDRAFT_814120 [Piloderma croceum F 1598]|uniref:Uncharacterized protein n=1 Tax=Piloderma croceum (strain F 1598) TaxID=765440 RepID=A0A0C3G8Y8_PILCF|nr:hypothetical protein PILCRDRAFT_814120 [Piloderma croceum F 1598]